ncbi:hydrogenase maturation protease [Arcobacter sp. CECT 8985]|uniref:hydrogenase maturation protease n=1 Tax=Arcobacter sp. CECT 8985 TaxID=1935424 RepID=UPI00100BB1FF|nr:hydrogenase maturation protease [Arcobacter sp. CECT 8985]RXJ88229.1 hydrogenase 3 maturation endopeptidase HyCI [Arcobacter sp. CECT 8985]
MKKAILTIGNILRGDDGITNYLGNLIEEEDKLDWKIFYGEDIPESQFNKIREYAPDLIIVADAITGINVGTVEVIDVSDDVDYMYSTHNLPAPILMSYLKNFCKRVLFLGLSVNLENVLDINDKLSQEAVNTAHKALKKVIEIDSIFESDK